MASFEARKTRDAGIVDMAPHEESKGIATDVLGKVEELDGYEGEHHRN